MILQPERITSEKPARSESDLEVRQVLDQLSQIERKLDSLEGLTRDKLNQDDLRSLENIKHIIDQILEK